VSKKIAVAGVAVALLAVLVLGLFLVLRPWEDQPPAYHSGEASTVMDLGVTYLPVTPKLAAYYGLGVDSGALVTEVIPGSPADQAGVRAGDVILSYNGVSLAEGAPLFGMMRACRPGDNITLEVWRGKSITLVELAHIEK